MSELVTPEEAALVRKVLATTGYTAPMHERQQARNIVDRFLPPMESEHEIVSDASVVHGFLERVASMAPDAIGERDAIDYLRRIQVDAEELLADAR